MICGKCGSTIEEGAEVCPNCGEAVPSPQVTGTVPEPADIKSGAVPEARITSQKRSSKGKGRLWIFLSALLFIAALLVYWFLPGNRYVRKMMKAYSYFTEGDLVAASELYYKALEIYPDDADAREDLDILYEIAVGRYRQAVVEGRYEEALDLARVANAVLREPDVDRDRNLYEVYDSWAGSCAEAGQDDDADSVMAAAEEEISNREYTGSIRLHVENARAYRAVAAKFAEVSSRVLEADISRDYKAVFSAMGECKEDLRELWTAYGQQSPVTVETAGTSFNWSYDPERGAYQLTIAGYSRGAADPSKSDSYYLSDETGHSEYEFFSSSWQLGVPQGEFYEIDFALEPVESGSNFVIYGSVKDGTYDGQQTIDVNGKTYSAHFSGGKVTVQDTADPNGDRSNVIAYTEDKNSWLSYPDSLLESVFGIRYIKE